MYHVYILKSLVNNKYYIGCTDNVIRRLKEHNSGLSKYTTISKPWNVVYQENFDSLSKARQREKVIKSWKSRSAIERLIGPVV